MKLHENSLLQVHPHEILMPGEGWEDGGGGDGGAACRLIYFTVCYLRFEVRRTAMFT